MNRVAIANHKGGSAKTTTAVNLAAALAELGRRVLVIDLDPQGSATSWFGLPLGERSVHDAYLAHNVAELVAKTTAPGVDLVPSSPWLVPVDRNEEISIGLGVMTALQRLPPVWDHVIVDCPPSHGSLAVAAVASCHNVLIPVETTVLALRGVVNLIETIEAVRERLNRDLAISGIVACRANRTRHAREIVERLRERYGALVFEAVVRESIGLAEAPSFQLPITRYRPEGMGSHDYRAVAREMLDRERSAAELKLAPIVPKTRSTEVLARR